MTTKMAIKSNMGAYGTARPDDPEPRGGGGRRAKPLLQDKLGRKGLEGRVEMGSWEERDWKEEWKWDLTRTLNHLSPKGLVGLKTHLKKYIENV